MKKASTLMLIAAAFTINAEAQNRAYVPVTSHINVTKVSRVAARGTGLVSGQILPLSFTDVSTCAFALYGNINGGYVTGVNSYGDKEKMMRYTLSDYQASLPARVDTAFVYFAAKYQVNNGNVTAKIYADDGSGAPGTLLATSAPKSVSQLDTTGLPTAFLFASAVNLTTDKYFVSVDLSALYATQDTVGILSSEEDCVFTDTASAWERFDDNTAVKMADSWPITLDMGIYSSVTATTVGINNVVKNNFSANAYPIPAKNMVTISFIGQDNSNTTLNLKDITGKMEATSSLKTIKGSTYKVPFAVDNLSSGMYFVEIASGNHKGMLKVSVQ